MNWRGVMLTVTGYALHPAYRVVSDRVMAAAAASDGAGAGARFDFDVIVVARASWAAARRTRSAPGALRSAPSPRLLARRVPHPPRRLRQGAPPAHGAPRPPPLGRRRGRVRLPRAHPGDASLLAAVENSGAGQVDLAERWGGVFRRVPDGWVTAVSELRGGVLNATKAVAMFQAIAVKEGAVVRDNAEVVGVIKKEGEAGVFVKTSGGEEFHGAKCVVTVGAWTSKLVKSVAGVDLPIQPLHTLVLYWRVKPGRERELTAEAGFPMFSSYGDPHLYSTPSLELPGLIKINYDGGPPCDPDNRDWATGGGDVASRVARWIEDLMPDHVETAGGPVVRQPCMYSMTPDKDFVIDFLGGEFGDDVVVGAGFSGQGFKMGPAVGRIFAEMAMDGEARTATEAGVELERFRINRFEGNPMGNVKDY